jgi:hypothetical protein
LSEGTHGVPDEDDELDDDDDPDELDDDELDEDEDVDEDELDDVDVPGSVSPQPRAAMTLDPSNVKSAAGPIERRLFWRFIVSLK